MRLEWPSHRNPGSAATLWRFAFRLSVIIALGLLWPGSSPPAATAAAALSLMLGVGCLVAADTFGEPIKGPGLNRWHEGAALLLIAFLLWLAS